MSIFYTKEYHVRLITNMVAEGITRELLESYIESAYKAAHRQGWEQCQKEAFEIARTTQIGQIQTTIAAMEYKEAEDE